MKKHKKLVLLPLVIALLLGSQAAYATDIVKEVDKHTVIKTAVVTLENTENPQFDAEQKIEHKGKTYRLKDTDIKILSGKVLEQDIVVKDKAKLKKVIYKNIEGKDLKYVLIDEPKDIKWKEVATELIAYKDIEYPVDKEISPTYTENGLEYHLTSTTNTAKTESFKAPAYFVGEAEGVTKFMLGDRIVEIQGDKPMWKGYENDIMAYLGVNGNTYKITSGEWKGDIVKKDNKYQRTAIYSGTRQVPLKVAHYTYNGDNPDATAYEATVRYELAEDYVIALATSTYRGLSPVQIAILAGAGIVVIAITIAAILFFLRKKRAKEAA